MDFPSGARVANTQTSIVCTSRVRSVMLEWGSTTGKTDNESLNRSEMKIRPNDF